MKKLKRPPKKAAKSLAKSPTNKNASRVYEDCGRFLVDASKLVLGGIVIAAILRYDLPKERLLTVGAACVIVFLVVGLVMGTRGSYTGGNHLEIKRRRPHLRKYARKRSKR